MYAIGHLIYGAPLTDELLKALEEAEIYADDWELGFTELYSGANAPAGYFGKELLEFDECEEILHFSKFEKAKADFTGYAEIQSLYDALPEKVKKAIQPLDFYITWSTS